MATREEILGKLYALRAGLSYIATQSNELQDAYECYKVYDNVTQDERLHDISNLIYARVPEYVEEDDPVESLFKKTNKRHAEVYKNTVQLLKTRFYRECKKKEIASLEKTEEDCYHSISREGKKLKIFCVLSIVAVAIALAGLIPLIHYLSCLFGDKKIVMNEIYMLVGIYCLLPVGLIMSPLELQQVFSELREVKKARKSIADCESELKYKRREEEMLKTQEIELTKTADRLRNEQETLRIAYENKKGEIIGTTYPVYVTLKQDYASIVSESDWENLDLIIYYFETGRATTVKEALFLVDRQKQTEAIVNAVQDAGNLISRTIVGATVALMQTIKVACTEICNNIKVVSGHLATISAGISSIAGGVSSLVDAAELQNALLSQANRSSADIAADVAYMRLEFEQKRRREGR